MPQIDVLYILLLLHHQALAPLHPFLRDRTLAVGKDHFDIDQFLFPKPEVGDRFLARAEAVADGDLAGTQKSGRIPGFTGRVKVDLGPDAHAIHALLALDADVEPVAAVG